MDESLARLRTVVTESVFSPAEIQQKTRGIQQQLLATSQHIIEPNFRSISDRDLEQLFQHYDRSFLRQACRAVIPTPQTRLTFRLSRRMTSAGGKTVRRKRKDHVHYEIVISTTLLFGTFDDLNQLDREITVSGLPCVSRFQALQRIMEHEMLHLIEWLVWGESSCAADRFQQLAQRLFGHRDRVHALITPRETAAVAHNIRPGDLVWFRMEKRLLRGRVNRITRRATVLVPDPDGQLFDDGKTYHRYYVPLNLLTRTSD